MTSKSSKVQVVSAAQTQPINQITIRPASDGSQEALSLRINAINAMKELDNKDVDRVACRGLLLVVVVVTNRVLG